jgi:hypothetical protein
VTRTNYSFTSFLPFIKNCLEREAIVRAGELGVVWRKYRRDRRGCSWASSRVSIQQRGYADVLEQLRVNAGFYSESSTVNEGSEIDEFELIDSDDFVDEEEEEEEA